MKETFTQTESTQWNQQLNKNTFHHVKSLSVFIVQITLVEDNNADIGTDFSFVNA